MSDNRRPRSLCGGYCVDGALRGAVVGLTWAAVHASYRFDCDPQLFDKRSFAKTLITYPLGCAAFIGMYQMLQCNFESSRGRVDWRNTACAGMLSGAIAGIPLAVKAREPLLVLALATAVAVITSGLEISK
eukprot:CAMPEP_0172198190 /NCGR_PEP_ID=MMETSP1050-20130122/27937_1 /TAXON_ID=233186 /ORGANISM="Cryptomonas curvata, Strain CCAP979/52" /LENGTH=130 /DNA_ID=CAMNT_0012874959 /DNA_START=14 /DNA_END=406 /DNA_ORIENTATION=-